MYKALTWTSLELLLASRGIFQQDQGDWTSFEDEGMLKRTLKSLVDSRVLPLMHGLNTENATLFYQFTASSFIDDVLCKMSFRVVS